MPGPDSPTKKAGGMITLVIEMRGQASNGPPSAQAPPEDFGYQPGLASFRDMGVEPKQLVSSALWSFVNSL